MAAASKGFGYARGEKVMKEIRGGLPEKDANKGFLGVSIGLLIIIVEYYGAAEPPVRCGESHLSGLTEPPHFVY